MSARNAIVAACDAQFPLVSVVVPAYNSARTIERCLGALLEQRNAVPFEVIVVDSGDDDTTQRALRRMPKARVVRLASRALAAEARNVGVAWSRADILAFIDSDAYADQDWISSVVEAANTGYDLVCGSVENANPASTVSRAEQLLMFNEFLPDLPARRSWFALSGNMVMPRRCFDRFGPFVAVRAAEDIVFSRRLIANGGHVFFYPKLRIFHENRLHLWPYLRNQFVIGRHTLQARRLVAFSDTKRFWLVVAALPVLPLIKLMKIATRFVVRRPRHLLSILRELPCFLVGIVAYSIGNASGIAWRPRVRSLAESASESNEPQRGKMPSQNAEGVVMSAADADRARAEV